MRKRWKEKTIYLSEKENEILKKKSKKLGLSDSEYVRQLIMNYKPTSPDIKILTKHSEDLKMLGNGFNAIARDAYRYGFVNTKDLNHYLEWLNYVMDDIRFNLNLK